MSGQRKIIDLIEKVKHGDKKAETKLYKYYTKTLKYFLETKYPTNNEIDDDISEIALRIYQNLDKYDNGKAKFKTWVINIANNYMIDKSRKKQMFNTNYVMCNLQIRSINKTDPLFIEDNLDYKNLDVKLPYSCQPDVNYENSNIIDHTKQLMDSIEESIFDMKSFGYNYKEIGCEFNMSENQVSNKISYFRNKIKKGDY